MARSYRHTPVIGNAGHSDKPGKVIANRTLRTRVRQDLRTCSDWDELVLPLLREVSNVWSFPKDGKHYMKNKSAPWYKKYMRK